MGLKFIVISMILKKFGTWFIIMLCHVKLGVVNIVPSSGLPLHGQDLTESITPYEGGIAFKQTIN